MTLYANVPLNNSYKNIIRFTNDAKAIGFLNPYVIGSTTQMNIPPYGDKNEIITSVCIDTAIAHVTRSELMTINYCLLVDTQTYEVTGELPVPYMYYFVTDIKWLGGHSSDSGKALLTLELDVATTYKLCGKTGFTEEVFTERQHCSRYIRYNNYYMFNDNEVLGGDPLDAKFEADIPYSQTYFTQNKNPYNENSYINQSPMILTRQEVYNLIDKWDWEVVVTRDKISTTNKVPFYRYTDVNAVGTLHLQGSYDKCVGNDNTFLVYNNNKFYDTSIHVYIAPVYKKEIPTMNNDSFYDDYLFVIRDVPSGGQASLHASGACPLFHPNYEVNGSIILSRFRLPVNFIYQFLSDMFVKTLVDVPDLDLSTSAMSTTPHTITKTMIGIKYKESDNWFITGGNISDGDTWSVYVEGGRLTRSKNPIEEGAYCSFSLSRSSYENEVFAFYGDDVINPTFNDILSVDSPKNESREPKLMLEPYSTYTLKSFVGTPNGFRFNPLLLESDRAKIIFKYVPNVSTAKFTMYIMPNPSKQDMSDECISPYNNLYKYNIGDVNITDYTMPIKSDPFFEMALNQRNYRTSGLVIPVAASLGQSLGILAGTSLVSGNIGASMPGTVTGLTAATTAAANYYTHIDNLKNAPDSIKNSGNDALHDSALGLDLRPFVEVYRMKEPQRKQVFDYYYRYGYMISTYKDYNQWFTRQIFNFVKTNDDLVDKFTKYNDVVIPYFIKVKLAEILNNGVTFWEQEQISKFLNTSFENVEYESMIPDTRL